MPPSEPSRAEEPVNILVVDDRQENRVALRAILSSPDCRVIEAASGSEALRELLARQFAVLLFDVVMPIMSGFELAAIVRQREQTASVPILFLTAEATDLDLVYRGYKVGAVDYLVKPLIPEMVRAKVSVFVELYRQRRRIEHQAKLLLEAARKESELKMLELRLAGERRFRHLADSIPHIIFTASPDGAVEYFNQRWYEYTGASVGDDAGSWARALHAEDSAGAQGAWHDAIVAGSPLEIQCRLRRAIDGEHRWHLCRILPDRSPDGRIVAWLGTFTDIEEQKRSHTVLAEFKGTLDAVQDAVIIFDATTWRVMHASHGASELLGYSADELVRMTPTELMPDFEQLELRQRVRPEASAPQTGFALETRYRRKDGEDVPVEVSFQHIRIDAGRVVAIGRDITERKRAESERRHLYEKAVEAVGIRDEFLSIASHELRTPLASLSLSIDSVVRLMREDRQHPAGERTEKRLKRAARQVERLTHLVSDLLDVARINKGRLDLNHEAMDLGTLVRDVVARFSEDAERAGCHVTVAAVAPVPGRWDAVRLEQVVINLLSNAMKFGAGKPVEIEVRGDDGWAILEVRDHGIGVTPEFRVRMFERFERGVSGRHFGGLGLGLYIVQKIVLAHGGDIAVGSDPGEGAAFTIRIPREPPLVEIDPQVTPPPQARQRALRAES